MRNIAPRCESPKEEETMTTSPRFMKSAAVLSVLGLALTACGNGEDGGDDAEGADNGDQTTENGGDNGGTEGGDDAEAGGSGETITLGIIPGWTDGVSMGNVWQQLLENQGYDVELTEV